MVVWVGNSYYGKNGRESCMRRTSLAPHRRRAGVSEVLGALLLIIVVVTAVASLSVFLTQAQANAQNRQQYLTSVADENLQVAYAQFSPNNQANQWELDSPTPTDAVYYVQMINSSSVLITQIGTPTISGTPTVSYPVSLMNGAFSDIAQGVKPTVTTIGSNAAIQHATSGKIFLDGEPFCDAVAEKHDVLPRQILFLEISHAILPMHDKQRVPIDRFIRVCGGGIRPGGHQRQQAKGKFDTVHLILPPVFPLN